MAAKKKQKKSGIDVRLGDRANKGLEFKVFEVSSDVTVIGGGISGMQAAITLAGLGHKVNIIEKEKELGGEALKKSAGFGYLSDNLESAFTEMRGFTEDLVGKVKADKNVTVYTNADLQTVEGELGSFCLTVDVNSQDKEIKAGAVILASGQEYDTDLEFFGFGNSPKIIDITQLSAILQTKNFPKNIAIVTDFAAQQGRALFAKVVSIAEFMTKRFGAGVKLYCSNAKVSAAGIESLYRRARECGVVFVRSEKKPTIINEISRVYISSKDVIADVELKEEFDLIVMADSDGRLVSDKLLELLEGFRCGPAGMQCDNVWVLPAGSNRPGVFVVGAAKGNSEFREALTDGLAAASDIHELFGGGRIEVCLDQPVVDNDKCVLCLTCLRICPHGAIRFDKNEKSVEFSAISCQRCGVCAAECPGLAIDFRQLSDNQIEEELGDAPKVTVFACENSAVPAAVKAVGQGCQFPVDVDIIKVSCAGRVDMISILNAFSRGAEKVMILGCHPESCQYLTGSSRAKKRIERIGSMLQANGFDRSRVLFGGIASVEPLRFAEFVGGKIISAGVKK